MDLGGVHIEFVGPSAIPSVLDVINLLMGLAVYIGLRAAFIFGNRKDFGKASYGRDYKYNVESDNGCCLIDILEFMFILGWWYLYLIFKFQHIVYGWKIILRRRKPGKPA